MKSAVGVRALATLALAVVGCADPFSPRTGVATLDDPVGDVFAAVSAGREHTCALTTDGSAYCWGNNELGQLGAASDSAPCFRDDRPTPCRRLPVAVAGGLKFRQIRAGGDHTCALALDRRIYCWGDNLFGELGDPTVRSAADPLLVPSGDFFVDLAAGGAHTCAIRTDGVALCWGANEAGQLGNGGFGNGSAVPGVVLSGQRFSSIVAGDNRTCASLADGSAFCWGATWVARQQDVEIKRAQSLPSRMQQAPAFQTLAVGTNTTCGVALDNRAYCWEANPTGSVGDGTTAGSSAPREVTGAERYVTISSGAQQTCAIADTGFAFCWGANDFGQLGVPPGALSTRCSRALVVCSRLPVRVSGWRVFSQLSAGQGNHVCALSIGGSVYCWGAGRFGQRGDGRTTNEWSPTRVRLQSNL